jgi:nucleoside-diphosphate-sugar epimerase
MKVLVTGSTGFIGNHVVRELLGYGHQVIATSKNPEKAKLCEWFPQVQYIPYDLTIKQENLFGFFQKPDVLIHLAWEGLPNYLDTFHFDQNLFLHYSFLKTLVEEGLKSLSVAGTCLEYGLQNGCLTEKMPTQPTTPYGLAKDTLRNSLENLKQKYHFSFKWLRLFYIYGKGQHSSSLFPQLDSSLEKNETSFNMSGGEQLRDYLPVKKMAEYIVQIAMQNKVHGIINCCSGTPISIRKLVEDYLDRKQKSIHLNLGYYPYPDYEPMAFWGCSDKLQLAVGSGSKKEIRV